MPPKIRLFKLCMVKDGMQTTSPLEINIRDGIRWHRTILPEAAIWETCGLEIVEDFGEPYKTYILRVVASFRDDVKVGDQMRMSVEIFNNYCDWIEIKRTAANRKRARVQ
jgi:hypothetical protein